MKKKFLFLVLTSLCFASLHAQYYAFQEAYDADLDNIEEEDKRTIGKDVVNKKDVMYKKCGIVCYVKEDDNYKTGIYAEGSISSGKTRNADFKRVVLVEPADLINAFEKCEEWHEQVSQLVEASGMSKTFTKDIASVGGFTAYVTDADKLTGDALHECMVKFSFVEESLGKISTNYGLKISTIERSQGINSVVSFINYAIDSADFQKEYRTAFTAMNKVVGTDYPSAAFVEKAISEKRENVSSSSKQQDAKNKLRNIEDLLQ